MTAIDWAIVALVVVLATLGFRQGLIVAALTLGGFAVGAFAGSRLAPLLLEGGSSSPYAPAIALLGGVVLGGLLAIMLEDAGTALRGRLIRGRLLTGADGIGGAAVLGALGLAIAWVIGAVVLNAPALKGARADVQRSQILSAVYERVAPSGPLLNVLHRIDRTPSVRGPSADVAAPDRAVLGDPEIGQASASVVRVLATACGLGISGSGWVAGPGVVVTNAHVVAGSDEIDVAAEDGTELDATAIGYRPRDDVAVLRVSGLESAPLDLVARPVRGSEGAVLGFPGGGDFRADPARLGTTGVVSSQDSYGRGPIERRMTSFRGRVISGNSGGPVVDTNGRVLTTVFASAVDSQRSEGLGVPNGIVRKALSRASEPVGTGSCA